MYCAALASSSSRARLTFSLSQLSPPWTSSNEPPILCTILLGTLHDSLRPSSASHGRLRAPSAESTPTRGSVFERRQPRRSSPGVRWGSSSPSRKDSWWKCRTTSRRSKRTARSLSHLHSRAPMTSLDLFARPSNAPSISSNHRKRMSPLSSPSTRQTARFLPLASSLLLPQTLLHRLDSTMRLLLHLTLKLSPTATI